MTIFRRDALEAQQTSWVGEIQPVRPLSLSLLSAVVVAAALAVGIFLALAEYTRKVRVSGVLVPDSGVIRPSPPQDALVLERRVAEGASARAVQAPAHPAAGRGAQRARCRP